MTCDQRPILVAATLVWIVLAGPAQAYRASGVVPLPRPRPAEAPAINRSQPPAEADGAFEPEKPPAGEARSPEPPPSACRLALDETIAIAPSIPAIHGPGACGGDDLVRLEAVVLPDAGRVPLHPAAIMRCTMASAVADWVRTDMAPLAAGLGTKISDLDNFDSFDCRGRNRVVGAKLSEHGRANALDVRAIKLASGQSIALTDRETSRELREKVLASVCTRFSTVLGPGSDGYHEDHVHLDLAERRGNYKICQWNVWDPLPKIAPLLPAERPADAPPRDIAEDKSLEAKPSDVKPVSPATAAPLATAPDVAEPERVPAPATEAPVPKQPRPRKRRPPPSAFDFLR